MFGETFGAPPVFRTPSTGQYGAPAIPSLEQAALLFGNEELQETWDTALVAYYAAAGILAPQAWDRWRTIMFRGYPAL